MTSVATIVGLAGLSTLFLLVPNGSAMIGDIYVDANDLIGPFEGTQQNPYQRITQALASPAASGDVIHVASQRGDGGGH